MTENKQTQKENTCVLGTFEENGLVYERIMLSLPQPIVNFYRFTAAMYDKDPTEGMADLELDVIKAVDARLDVLRGDELKSYLNLKKSIDRYIHK